MDSPPIKGCNRWLSKRRKNAYRYMMVFAAFLLLHVISIHTRFMSKIIADSASSIPTSGSLSNRIRVQIDVNNNSEPQKIVIMYGTISSGYLNVQNNFNLWNKEFKLYPWAWALPELQSNKYNKDQNFAPYLESLIHISSMKLNNEPFNVKKLHLANFYLNQFRDGFIHEWMQNRNILIGSDAFSYILDETNGDKFMKTLIETLPWNDPRYNLMKHGDLSVIILHRSFHREHLKELWISSNRDNVHSLEIKFSSWIANEFDFNTMDSYGLAYNLVKRGIKVSLVIADEVEKDLSYYIVCHVLKISCDDAYKGDLTSDKQESKSNLNFDVKEDTFTKLERAITKHESILMECLRNNQYFNIYPQKGGKRDHSPIADVKLCTSLNHLTKNELRNIILNK